MVPKGDPRESKFTLLLSEEERNMLVELAHEEGLSAAMWLRRLIRAQHKAFDLARQTASSAKLLAEVERSIKKKKPKQ